MGWDRGWDSGFSRDRFWIGSCFPSVYWGLRGASLIMFVFGIKKSSSFLVCSSLQYSMMFTLKFRAAGKSSWGCCCCFWGWVFLKIFFSFSFSSSQNVSLFLVPRRPKRAQGIPVLKPAFFRVLPVLLLIIYFWGLYQYKFCGSFFSCYSVNCRDKSVLL